MPREWKIKIQDWPIKSTSKYTAIVKSIKKDGKNISVTLEHTEGDLAGMETLLQLPGTIMPGNVTAKFFSVCGLDIIPDQSISPKNTIGKSIKVRYKKTDNQWQASEFFSVSSDDPNLF